jgi:PPE family
LKVDAAGLVAAAQRVAAAVDGVAGGAAVHPPLAADQVSGGAAARLSTAGAQLAAALGALSAGLVASAEQLTGVALGFVATDEYNAARIATLADSPHGPSYRGWAPPAPPLPPDVRAPLPAPIAASPEAISAAVHSGDPGAGEPFIGSWSQVADAAADAAAVLRSTINHLPDTLDGPVSAPAVSRHLRRYAEECEACGTRAQQLARQATEHAAQQTQARQDIPHPQQLQHAQDRVQTIALANTQSHGAYAAPLAQATADLTALNDQAVQGFTGYHLATDATTAGGLDEPDTGASDADHGGAGDTTTDDGRPGVPAGTDPPSPQAPDQIAGLLPELIPAALGSTGGLLGGLVGAATKAPQSLMQAGTQALSGLMSPRPGDPSPQGGEPGAKPDLDSGEPDDLPTGGVGDGGQTVPAAGGFITPSLPVAPSAGAESTSPTLPTVASPAPSPPAGPPGMMPMGMPMGGMGGRGRGAGKEGPQRTKRVVAAPIPHTEEVTGKVSARRLAVSATAPKDPDLPPGDESSASPPAPTVRRIVSRRPGDSS